jgi:hypothetical protein
MMMKELEEELEGEEDEEQKPESELRNAEDAEDD